MKKLEGKVAIVAGGAKNLGGLISRQLAEQGSKVIVHYNSDATKSQADETVKAINEMGSEAYSFQADLTIPENNDKLFEFAKEKFGRVDIAINTAGIVIKKPILEVTEEDYNKSFDINSKAAFFFIKSAGKYLEDKGRICTIVSSLLAAYTGLYAVYPGSKSAVEHYTRAASKEFGDRGISVTAVGPGPMDTPFFYGQESKEAVAYHSTAAALSGYSKTGLTDIEDISPIVLFLVTDGWWITGQTIFANGGYTTR